MNMIANKAEKEETMANENLGQLIGILAVLEILSNVILTIEDSLILSYL